MFIRERKKTWVNSIVRVDRERESRVEEREGMERRERKTRRRTAERRRTGRWSEEETEKRNKSKKQGGRRRQQSLVSRLIPLPPSHLVALSHATSGCVGVSGRLKKHGCLRPSIQKKTVDPGKRIREKKKERKKRRERRNDDELVARTT